MRSAISGASIRLEENPGSTVRMPTSFWIIARLALWTDTRKAAGGCPTASRRLIRRSPE
jgi:hypothetical protein